MDVRGRETPVGTFPGNDCEILDEGVVKTQTRKSLL
jgi:hypothetical protein